MREQPLHNEDIDRGIKNRLQSASTAFDRAARRETTAPHWQVVENLATLTRTRWIAATASAATIAVAFGLTFWIRGTGVDATSRSTIALDNAESQRDSNDLRHLASIESLDRRIAELTIRQHELNDTIRSLELQLAAERAARAEVRREVQRTETWATLEAVHAHGEGLCSPEALSRIRDVAAALSPIPDETTTF